MAEAALSLVHRVHQPVHPIDHPPLLILLHGVGGNEQNLFTLTPQLDTRCVIISARAPHQRGRGSFAWFNVQFAPSGPVILPEQAEASRQLLLRFIDEAVGAYGTDPRQVYLMGFSQGAIMSASVALTVPEVVAGAVLMSGRILPEIRPLIADDSRLSGLPFLVIHGTADNVLPIHHGRASRDLLTSLPIQLTYREYAMGHEIRPESLADIQTWLRKRLDRPGYRH
jgi:phospholipase/carboxylesterase